MGFLEKIFGPSVSGLKSRRDVDGLIALLNHQDWKKAAAAAEALGELGDLQATEPLITTLRADTGASVQAAYALGKLRDPRAVDPLIGLIETPSDSLRSAAILVLGKIGDSRACPALISFLLGPGKSGKPEAAMALGVMGGFEAITPLTACLSNDDNRVRAGAANALNELAQSHQLSLAPNADQVVATLISAFEKEENYSANAAMAKAIGNLGDSRAIAPLYRKGADSNIALSLAVSRETSAGLSKLGASQDQVSAWVRRPIDSWLAIARALITLGEDTEYVIEKLKPALHGIDPKGAAIPHEMRASLLAQIRKQAPTKAAQPLKASAHNPSCGRCGKKLELEPLNPSDALQARLPRTYLGAVCDVCSKVECYRCRGTVVAPCSWCKGHCSPAYVTKFSKS